MKIQIKNYFRGGPGGGVGLGGSGWMGGCERRIEVFEKIPKKKNICLFLGGGVREGVRVDVNKELKFL